MKKTIISFFISCLSIIAFGQANTYFHDRIDTTLFAIADTVGHGSNHYYATNLTPDFNVKQYVNGCTVNLFFKKGNTGSATLTLVTKTGTLSSKTIRKANGQVLLSGDIPDSTAVILDYYNGSFRIAGIGVTASSSSWLLTGNSGTTAGTNFIGTIDSVDFVFKVNNRERARINRNGGSFTLGATSITQGKMIMKGLTSGSVTITPAAAAGDWIFTLPTDDGTASQFLQTDGSGITSWQTVTPATIGAWALTGNSGTTAGTNFVGTTDDVDMVFKRNSTEIMRLYSSNNYVGIGTAAPTAKLEVKGEDNGLFTYSMRLRGGDNTLQFEQVNYGITRVYGVLQVKDDIGLGFSQFHGASTVGDICGTPSNNLRLFTEQNGDSGKYVSIVAHRFANAIDFSTDWVSGIKYISAGSSSGAFPILKMCPPVYAAPNGVATYTANATVTASEISTGMLAVSSGTLTLTMPTGTNLTTFYGSVVGTEVNFSVSNVLSGGTCTIAVNTGIVAADYPTTPDANQLTLANSITQGVAGYKLIEVTSNNWKITRIY